MQCDNCTDEGEIAFTLMTYVEDRGNTVTADFCSIECLQEWTGGNVSFGEWVAGPDASAGGLPASEGTWRTIEQ